MPQSYTDLCYHLVWSTKNREPYISPELMPRLYDYIGGIVRGEKGTLLEVGGRPDHVHLLARLHPSIAVADLLRVVKTNSSKWLRETFPDHQRFAWQSGYGAFSVSRSRMDQVRQYIQNQEAHHRRVAFKDEFEQLLRKHGIEFDPEYIWA
jgi:putative transposase